MLDYEGDDIGIEELATGCVISQERSGEIGYVDVVVTSNKDALALIASLTHLIRYNISQGIG